MRKIITCYLNSYAIHCSFLHLLILTYATLLPVSYSMFTDAKSVGRRGGGGVEYDKTCPLSFFYSVDFMMIPPMFIMLQIYFITIKQFIKPPDISKFTYEASNESSVKSYHFPWWPYGRRHLEARNALWELEKAGHSTWTDTKDKHRYNITVMACLHGQNL